MASPRNVMIAVCIYVVARVTIGVGFTAVNKRQALTLEQRDDLCNVNRGGPKATHSHACISGMDWNFVMRISPLGSGAQAYSF